MKGESLDFESEIVLEDHRVRLEPYDNSNIIMLEHFSIEEPELWQYSLVPADGKDQFDSYVNKALQGRSEKWCYPFAIYDKKKQKYAGSTRFYDYQAHHKTTQIGYTWLGKDFQGRGLNKHCKFVMLQFAFETIKLERVEFRADAKNAKSIAAMKRIGCTVEGVLRSNCRSLDGRRDSIVLSILKEEWDSRIKAMLRSYVE